MPILAIDYGLKKIGIAVSTGFLARPLFVIPNNQKIFEKLNRICKQFDITEIVIGISEGKLKNEILKFGNITKQKLRMKIEFEDEILTTTKAQKLLIEARSSKKKRRESLDAAAAAVILQQYLDRKK